MKRVVVAFALLISSHALGHRVREIDLVADQPGVARFTDPNLVNPWGLVIEHDKLRVANNHSGLSTLYFENGFPAHRTITIPPPKGAEGPSAPTMLNRPPPRLAAVLPETVLLSMVSAAGPTRSLLIDA